MRPFAAQIRQRTLAEWYLADRGDQRSSGARLGLARRHPAWQSPFALPLPGGGSASERARRIRLAGSIWLRNDDLRFQRQLWLWDTEAATTWAFRRCCEPGGRHIRVGPVPLLVLDHGRRLFEHPVFYRETDDPELDRRLLAIAMPLDPGDA